MTVTIDSRILGLSDSDWDRILDAADTWNDDFTTDGMPDVRVTALHVLVTELAGAQPQNAALATLVAELHAELAARAQLAVAQALPDPVADPVHAPVAALVADPPVDPADVIPEAPGDPGPVSGPGGLPVVPGAYHGMPAEHTKVVGFLGGRIPLRNKNLVDLAVKAYYGVNREDVVAEISARYEEVTGAAYVEPAGVDSVKTSKRPGYKDTDSVITGAGGYPPHWPVVPADVVPVHEGSVAVFQTGSAGQAYTGIVRFGGRSEAGAPNEPKIILFPTQAEGDYLALGVRAHDGVEGDGAQLGRVYRENPEEYTTHSGGGAASSHGKLAAHIAAKRKYADLAVEGQDYQESGLTIGFTVIRGGASTAHKFSFVSRSSNNPTFALVSAVEAHDVRERAGDVAVSTLIEERRVQYQHLQIEGDGSVTRAWADKIISSVEAAMAAAPD